MGSTTRSLRLVYRPEKLRVSMKKSRLEIHHAADAPHYMFHWVSKKMRMLKEKAPAELEHQEA